ncbi:MAG: cellulase family glycosylhydrolase [Kiritimatiellae bacterium]|nr:cellulase family glycosylhydrolase [Kiritimatiellia bacterium]
MILANRNALRIIAPLLLASLAPDALAVVSFPHSAWSLPSGARIDGDTLVVDIPHGAADRRDARASAKIDCAGAIADFRSVVASVRVRAEDVSEPDHPWNGVKVQLRYTDLDGKAQYPAFELPRGSFDWTNATVRLSALANPLGIGGDGRATLLLGLEGCTGHAEFDLASLRIDYEDTGIPREDEVRKARCPSRREGEREAPHSRILRGCMLPARATTEGDIAELASWGATLVRFQITRDFGKINANLDLDEYAAWVDSRLDNLEEVLGWAEVRGMKVCVDLHATPGGVRVGDRATAMLYDERLAQAYVETWRRIAARCAPIVQTKGPVIYGYDLVNEPKQIAFAPISYWEIQRRAAKAIRAIDPVTPIVVESNISASPTAFAYLQPLAMDNVIYQLHMYAPGDYTHQGVGRALTKDGRPLVWPDPSRGWDADWLRRVLEPVRSFQEKHQCRIYVGEFSAVAWAPGAENYLRDCIVLFEEYGWDWTYHAFREWSAWSVEHEVPGPGKPPTRSADNPRKRALLDWLRR